MTKPDCTLQRFGRLRVVGKSRPHPKYGHLWVLRCDCGTVLELPRSSFDKQMGQVSCGCKRRLGMVDNKRRPHNITGQKFGALTAIALTGKRDKNNKPTWLFQCDCGSSREMSLSCIRGHQSSSRRINCGVKANHPERWLHYPPAPIPYPKDAAQILIKYLPYTELTYFQVDSALEDEKRDRLLRAAWIVTYRRSQGEDISDLHEKRIILKHLRYCSIDVFWRRKLESMGGLIYDRSGKKKHIGITMTNITSSDYPAIETQGINRIPTKRMKFKRC